MQAVKAPRSTARSGPSAGSAGRPRRREGRCWSVLQRIPTSYGAVEIVEYDVVEGANPFDAGDEHVLEMLLDASPLDRQATLKDGRTYPLGDINFYPAGHRLEVAWPGTMHVRAVRCTFLDKYEPAPRTWHARQVVAGFDVRSAVVRHAMNLLSKELSQPGFQSTLLLDAHYLVAAVELGRYFRRPLVALQKRLTQKQLDAINELIARPGHSPNAAELAAVCRLSRRHFFRLLRQATGMSVTEYIEQQRIERAKVMLQDDAVLIKQIAYDCGYQTASAFCAAFRRNTGLTPGAFRATLSGDQVGVAG